MKEEEGILAAEILESIETRIPTKTHWKVVLVYRSLLF